MKCIWVISCVAAFFFSTGSAQKVVFQDVCGDITDNIFIYLIQGPNFIDRVKMKLEDGLTFPNYDFFNSTWNTTFYFHGWLENIDSESCNTIGTAFLQKKIGNIVFFDFSQLVKFDYISAAANASLIGKAIGQYIKQYTQKVQIKDLLHLVGHSLGSQVMSYAARTYGIGLLPWLTGLDPAGPYFNFPLVDHLTASDGIFVDVIHTDGGFFGDFRTIGTVDIFPNRGTRVQPHCYFNIDLFCNHAMSWRYYAEAITYETNFPARRCTRSAYCDLSLYFCDCDDYNNEIIYIGLNVNKSAKGTFYLKTACNSPYGEGEAGMDFK